MSGQPLDHFRAQPGTARAAMHLFRRRYGAVLEWVVMVLMILLSLEVTLGIVFRFAGRSLVWYDEVASVMLAWLTFYGSALASVKRGHIGCPEIVEQFSPGFQRIAGIVAQILVILFFGLLGWVGLSIMPALAGDALVSLPWVSMNFVQSVIPVSAALILLAEVMFLIDLVGARGQPPRPAGASMPDGTH
jgi:TRAP-type C4-dicarboxylate transport system permease small subunit